MDVTSPCHDELLMDLFSDALFPLSGMCASKSERKEATLTVSPRSSVCKRHERPAVPDALPEAKRGKASAEMAEPVWMSRMRPMFVKHGLESQTRPLRLHSVCSGMSSESVALKAGTRISKLLGGSWERFRLRSVGWGLCI